MFRWPFRKDPRDESAQVQAQLETALRTIASLKTENSGLREKVNEKTNANPGEGRPGVHHQDAAPG